MANRSLSSTSLFCPFLLITSRSHPAIQMAVESEYEIREMTAREPWQHSRSSLEFHLGGLGVCMTAVSFLSIASSLTPLHSRGSFGRRQRTARIESRYSVWSQNQTLRGNQSSPHFFSRRITGRRQTGTSINLDRHYTKIKVFLPPHDLMASDQHSLLEHIVVGHWHRESVLGIRMSQ